MQQMFQFKAVNKQQTVTIWTLSMLWKITSEIITRESVEKDKRLENIPKATPNISPASGKCSHLTASRDSVVLDHSIPTHLCREK